MPRNFTIKARIEAEDAASGPVGKVQDSFGSLGEELTKQIATYASVGAAVGALTKFLGDSVSAANESEDALTKLHSALKLLGPSGLQVEEALKRQAGALQDTTRFSDEAVESAQALLATYGVTADQLGVATQATADLAARLGIDLQSAAGQVGAAFNGITRGLEKVVPGLKSVSDAGFDGAQNIQLLADTMKGGAVEAADTFSGSLAKLANQWDELHEAVGRNITQGAQSTGFMTLLNAAVQQLIALATSGTPVIAKQADSIAALGTASEAAVRSVTKLADIQDRSTRILSEQATAQQRASDIAKELGITLEVDVIQKREREAELLKELAGLEAQGADVRVAAVESTQALGEATGALADDYGALGDAVFVVNGALGTTPALFQQVTAQANAAAQAIVFTVQAFDAMRNLLGSGAANATALQNGGKLINKGTMIQFPDGSVRLVDAAMGFGTTGGGGGAGVNWYGPPTSGAFWGTYAGQPLGPNPYAVGGGGQFVNLNGTPRRF